MPIYRSGTEKPGGPFAIVESGDILGGLHHVALLANLTDGTVIPAVRVAGMLVTVAGGALYQLNGDLVTWLPYGPLLAQDDGQVLYALGGAIAGSTVLVVDGAGTAYGNALVVQGPYRGTGLLINQGSGAVTIGLKIQALQANPTALFTDNTPIEIGRIAGYTAPSQTNLIGLNLIGLANITLNLVASGSTQAGTQVARWDLTKQHNSVPLQFGAMSTVSVSDVGAAQFRFNEVTNHLESSENGGPWTQLGGGSGGGGLSGLTAGQVLFATAPTTVDGSTGFTWDAALAALSLTAIGSNTPLSVHQDGGGGSYGIRVHAAAGANAAPLVGFTIDGTDTGYLLGAAAAGAGNIAGINLAAVTGRGIGFRIGGTNVASLVGVNATVLSLNGGSSNWLAYNTNGIGPPQFGTSSAGTKLILYPAVDGSHADYAMGLDNGAIWQTLGQASAGLSFKWYGGTTLLAQLDGAGHFVVNGIVEAMQSGVGSTQPAGLIASNSTPGTADAPWQYSPLLQLVGHGYWGGVDHTCLGTLQVRITPNQDTQLVYAASTAGGGPLVDVISFTRIGNDSYLKWATGTASLSANNGAIQINAFSAFSPADRNGGDLGTEVRPWAKTWTTDLDAAGTVSFNGGQHVHRTAVADGNYTNVPGDYLIVWTALTATRVLTATNNGGTAAAPMVLKLKDESGGASGAVTINVAPASGTIDGATSKDVIVSAYGTTSIYCNGTNWFTL